MRLRLPRPTHATVVAYVALFAAMTGTAAAATGGTFLLGKSNAASTTTSLTNSAGTSLKLTSKAGTPPLAVSNTVRIPYLNADLLDGLSSASFLRSTGTAANASKLGGLAPGAFALASERESTANVYVTATVTGGMGEALCPAGYYPIGGGGIPDVTGGGALPTVVASTFNISDAGAFDGWWVAFTGDASYNGGGFVTVACSNAPSTDAPSPAALQLAKAMKAAALRSAR